MELHILSLLMGVIISCVNAARPGSASVDGENTVKIHQNNLKTHKDTFETRRNTTKTHKDTFATHHTTFATDKEDNDATDKDNDTIFTPNRSLTRKCPEKIKKFGDDCKVI